MEVLPIRVEQYVLPNGSRPFQDWFGCLTDEKTKRIIRRRLERLQAGNFGDCKFFESIIELRIDHGPGIRIYCGKKNNSFVILLVGGTKKSQDDDIKTAQEYWLAYQKRTSG